jgi:hypothetical protein
VFLGFGLALLTLTAAFALVFMVLRGKSGTPAKRLGKILKSWPRKP